MTISCPNCGREMQMEPRLFGHLLGCPYCQARFSAPNPFRKAQPDEEPCDDSVDAYWKDDSDYYYYDDDEE